MTIGSLDFFVAKVSITSNGTSVLHPGRYENPKTIAELMGWAAFGGNLSCLQYLREKKCEWNEVTCAQAALGGHLDILRAI